MSNVTDQELQAIRDRDNRKTQIADFGFKSDVGTLLQAIRERDASIAEYIQAFKRERDAALKLMQRVGELEVDAGVSKELRKYHKEYQQFAIAEQERLRSEAREQTAKRIQLERQLAELRKPVAVEPNYLVEGLRDIYGVRHATHWELNALLSAYDTLAQDLARANSAHDVHMAEIAGLRERLEKAYGELTRRETRIMELEQREHQQQQTLDHASGVITTQEGKIVVLEERERQLRGLLENGLQIFDQEIALHPDPNGWATDVRAALSQPQEPKVEHRCGVRFYDDSRDRIIVYLRTRLDLLLNALHEISTNHGDDEWLVDLNLKYCVDTARKALTEDQEKCNGAV